MSSIDKEIARDITVAWLNSGKLSEEYLSKKQVAAFYECVFQTVVECKAQQKSAQTEAIVGSYTTPQQPASSQQIATSRPPASSMSKHRF